MGERVSSLDYQLSQCNHCSEIVDLKWHSMAIRGSLIILRAAYKSIIRRKTYWKVNLLIFTQYIGNVA